MTKIMLVEDDNNLREIYEARLTAEGYEIVSAENGEAALAMAAKERPDMIISDVMMPKISGFEMLDILRNTNGLKNVKIIMLTALGQAEDNQRANQLGADRYLVKSQVTLEDIVKAAHDLLDDPNSLATVAPTVPDETPAVETATDAPEAVTDTSAAETAAPAPVEAPAEVVEPASVPDVQVPVEPAPVAEEPAVSTEPATPAELAPVEPASTAPAEQLNAALAEAAMPMPEPMSVITPDVASTPAEPVVQDPGTVTAPVEQATPEVVSPEPPVAPQPAAPTVISIPVSDGSDTADTSATDATDTQSSLSVAEPPADPAADAPTADSSTPPVGQDNAVTTPELTDLALESSVSDTAAAPLQDESGTGTAVPDNVAADTGEQSADFQQTTAPADASAAPSVEIPSIVAEPDASPASDVASDLPVVEGPPIDEPAAEDLNGFAAPVISSTDGVDIPAPTSVEVNQPTVEQSPVEQPAEQAVVTANDDQLREAAEDLAASVTATNTSSPDSAGRLKTIAPLPSDNKPTIHQLLAVEEAKSSAQQAAAAQPTPAQPNVDAYNAPTPPVPQQPAADGIDPNSISL